MGTRGIGPNVSTYVACLIGSFILGLVAGTLYTNGHDSRMMLPILGGGALVVLSGLGAFMTSKAQLRLVYASAIAFGVALFLAGFHN
ncbi:MAG TPA: hypothetical protein VJ843_05445 [Candidatus Saccharimonadales bacterium]|nr:hypothetical protein [Candidatus Saccharimonadales bacterium]